MPVKVGDTVTCAKRQGMGGGISIGCDYKVTKIGNNHLYVINDFEVEFGYYFDDFKCIPKLETVLYKK